MNNIDKLIAELQKKKKKIEFLTHILDSAKSYDHKDFKEVKDDVVKILSDFVEKASIAIEKDTDIFAIQKVQAPSNDVFRKDEPSKTPEQQKEVEEKQKQKDPGYLLSFAMDNRHLSGKKVQVINEKNVELNGEVVGLDAPHVLVKTTTGHVIKVPLENVVVT